MLFLPLQFHPRQRRNPGGACKKNQSDSTSPPGLSNSLTGKEVQVAIINRPDVRFAYGQGRSLEDGYAANQGVGPIAANVISSPSGLVLALPP